MQYTFKSKYFSLIIQTAKALAAFWSGEEPYVYISLTLIDVKAESVSFFFFF